MKSLLTLLSLCLMCTSQAAIQNIPKSDVKNIEYLFGRLVNGHDFAYTIFGSKPMSLAAYTLEMPKGLPIHKWIRTRYRFLQGKASLKSWYKYRHEFDFKNFILLDEEEDLFNCQVFALIHKKNLLATLHKHESAFKETLGDAFTPQSFLNGLEQKEVSLAQAIHKSDRLLGIMLGYGERNASLFQERFDLQKEISNRKKNHLAEDSLLTQKLIVLESQAGDFSEFEADPIIPPLYFLADLTHPETIKLQLQYKADRTHIEQLKQQPHFLNRAFKILTSTSDCLPQS